MKNYVKQILFVAALLATGFSGVAFLPIAPKVVEGFTLRNIDGRPLSLDAYPDAKGFIVVFTCNHCPFAKLYPERMNALNTKYKPLGLPLIAISSTDTNVFEEDTYPKMVEKAQNEHFNFPYLFDAEQTVAKSFGAQKTPHAYIIWKENGKWAVKYNGAIDDNGAEPTKATKHFVADAADALLNGKAGYVKETKSVGCQINFRAKK